MGFGSGYSRKSDNGGKRYSNDMTAHVWAQAGGTDGQSNNGNLFFRGRTLYSYGTHFIVGYIAPDGVALLNADSYSVTTSGHQSDARGAVKHRRTVSVPNLTAILDYRGGLTRLFRAIEAGERPNKAEVRAFLRDQAANLNGWIYAPNAERYSWDSDAGRTITNPGEIELGGYIAKLAGLPAASWDKAKRDAASIKRRADADKAKVDADKAEKRALWLADMSDRDWRGWLARMGTDHSSQAMTSTATELRRARKLALAATRGKLASAKRLASIRARLKRITAEIETFQAKRARRVAGQRLAVALANVRNHRDSSDAAKLALEFYGLQNLERDADYLAEHGRLSSLRASAARLSIALAERKAIVATEEQARREAERINREKEKAERERLWMAGEHVGRVYFDAPSGGAAMRIVGENLETSHGASVPLAHAIRAFRFVKLCRERGETWNRNGRTIRVGHFQVDAIAADGSFVAGCHSFTWPEIERIAAIAGVADAEPSADAVTLSSEAA